MTTLTPEQAAVLAKAAGFSGSGLTAITAIMGRESGYNPAAYNGTGPDNSVGLTQINLIGSLLPGRIGILNSLGYNIAPGDESAAIQALQNPLTNLKVAYVLSGKGTDFSPWKMSSDPNSFLQGTNVAAAQQAVSAADAAYPDLSNIPLGRLGDSAPMTTNSSSTPRDPFDVAGVLGPAFAAGANNSSGSGSSLDDLIAQALAGGTSTKLDPAEEAYYNALAKASTFGLTNQTPDNAASVAEQAREFNNLSPQDVITNAYNDAVLKEKEANDAAQQALQAGDLQLSQQKEADANYWNQVQANLTQQSNAITQRGQDITNQDALAAVASSIYSAQLTHQANMAGAQNNYIGNQVSADQGAGQLASNAMDDYTKQLLGLQSNQTSQFNAETNRATGMGQLGLQTDQFIDQMAQDPKNLYELYFMQRGISPDWDTMAAGGTPAQGQALAPVNPMTAYVPTTAPPQISSTPSNPYAQTVLNYGAQSVAAAQQPNQFIGAPQAQAPDLSQYQVPPRVQSQPIAPAPTPVLGDPTYSGVPNTAVANLGQGQTMNFVTGGLGPSNATTYINNGYKVMDANGTPYASGTSIAGNTPIELMRLASGGMTTDRMFVAGDAPSKDPSAGGARPELIENPTGAPFIVHPNARTVMAYAPNRAVAQARNLAAIAGPTALRHYAMGTDSSQAYADAGMGQDYMPSSSNAYLQDGTPLPTRLAMLAQYGAPIPPSLYQATTGQNLSPDNMGYAYTVGRQAGVLPSLQTLNAMSPGEQGVYQGYAQGVAGIPWADLVDYLAAPTKDLQTAVAAKAA